MPEIAKQNDLAQNELYRRHKARIDTLMGKYPTRQSMLLPLLWIIQEEDGWVGPEVMAEAAAICGCTSAEVMEVASFYQMYSRKPLGKYVFGICGTLPCALVGADGLYDYISEKLGIGWEETTEDGMFTIQRRECLGACSEGPVMLFNQTILMHLTKEKIDQLLEECRQGKPKPYYTGRNGKS